MSIFSKWLKIKKQRNDLIMGEGQQQQDKETTGITEEKLSIGQVLASIFFEKNQDSLKI